MRAKIQSTCVLLSNPSSGSVALFIGYGLQNSWRPTLLLKEVDSITGSTMSIGLLITYCYVQFRWGSFWYLDINVYQQNAPKLGPGNNREVQYDLTMGIANKFHTRLRSKIMS